MSIREDYEVYLVEDDRTTYWRVWQYEGLSFNVGRLGQGTLSIQFTLEANDLPEDFANKDSWYGWSIDIYTVGSTLLWSGPVVKGTFEVDTSSVLEVTLEAETFMHHLLRRRLNVDSSNSDLGYSVTEADTIIASIVNLARTNITGYPVGVTRSSFAPWTVPAMSARALASKITWQEQSGNNLWDSVESLCSKGDIALVLTESPAGTFTYSTSTPYQNNDYTESVVISDRVGELLAIRKTVDFTGLSNVWLGRGNGSGSSQTYEATLGKSPLAGGIRALPRGSLRFVLPRADGSSAEPDARRPIGRQ